MKRPSIRGRQLAFASVAIAGCLAGVLGFAQSGPAPSDRKPPDFHVDASWPKPLPNKWIAGQVSGIAVDTHDHVWILHRPATLAADEKSAGATPPVAECCIPAPPVIEFDAQGNFVQAWGGAVAGYDWPTVEHGINVDYQGNVWISGTGAEDGQILEFSSSGKFLRQIGHPNRNAGNNDTATLWKPAAMTVDPKTRELYVADGEGGNRRVIVFDAETGAYKRHWGAYGEKPDEGPAAKYDPDAPTSKVFSSAVHCVSIAKDGLVYVCDRGNNRIQVFHQDGGFVKETVLAKRTLSVGSTSDIGISPDQQFLYVADGTNQKVWVLQRNSLEVLGSFGQLGHNAGQFRNIHAIAVDSKGNVYTAEVSEGKRAQKFIP
jgi:NHL repeat